MQREYTPVFRSICTSKKMAKLKSDTARLFYLLLIVNVDSHGRIENDPETLTAIVWPMLGHTPKVTEDCLQQLAKVGLIGLYSNKRSNDKMIAWIQVENWETFAGSIGHPNRRGESHFPAPDQSGLLRSDPDHSPQSRVEENRVEETRVRATAPAALGLDDLVTGTVIDTPACREALETWTAYKRQRGQGYKPIGLKALVRDAVAIGPAGLAAAVQHSMGSNYAGLFPPKADTRQEAPMASVVTRREWKPDLSPRIAPPENLMEMLAEQKRIAHEATLERASARAGAA